MDSFIDDFLSNPSQWLCPNCASSGISAQVKLVQVNASTALYTCETPECEYPLGSGSLEGILVHRSALELPPEEKHLAQLNLPLTLLTEPGLQMCHLFELVKVQVAIKFLPDLLKADKRWKFFEKGFEETPKIERLAQLQHLKRLSPFLIQLSKHLDPDIERIIQMI